MHESRAVRGGGEAGGRGRPRCPAPVHAWAGKGGGAVPGRQPVPPPLHHPTWRAIPDHPTGLFYSKFTQSHWKNPPSHHLKRDSLSVVRLERAQQRKTIYPHRDSHPPATWKVPRTIVKKNEHDNFQNMASVFQSR